MPNVTQDQKQFAKKVAEQMKAKLNKQLIKLEKNIETHDSDLVTKKKELDNIKAEIAKIDDIMMGL
jgi:septal ring factor EnvC (AmiA/AmiB activator)